MPIQFFPVIDAVLTQAMADICHAYQITEDEAIKIARQYLAINSSAYYTDDPDLDYDNPLCRIAYLYTYVGAHANLIDNAFYKFDDLKDFVLDKVSNEEPLHVCSFGGGPGSELLGFVKFIERVCNVGNQIHINFALVDNVTQWDETWHALVNGLETTFRNDYGLRRNWPVIVHRSFLTIDMTQLDDIAYLLARFRDIQIYVLNHTVSELLAHEDEFADFFALIASRASDGAYFLFIDRRQDEVIEAVDRLIQVGSLEHLGTQTERTNMDRDEQKTALGRWYYQMGRDPKIKWNAFYTLARKVEWGFW